MSVFAGIVHLYGDAGLLRLLHESGVYAPATAQQILLGRDFDRALRALKLVHEVLGIFFHQFRKWCILQERTIPSEVHDKLKELEQLLVYPQIATSIAFI